MDFINQICAMIQGCWFVATPALCLVCLTSGSRAVSVTRIGLLVTDVIATTLFITDRGWYAARHLATTPGPALWSATIDLVPTLLVFGCAFLLSTRHGLRGWRRGLYSLLASYFTLFLCAIPAVLVFVQLGGDSL